jgi:hypothetical protein
MRRKAETARAAHRPMMHRLPLLAAGAATLVLSTAAGAAEVPTLPPGRTATMAGTHVRCMAIGASVICSKVGGLTATILQTGSVHVTRGPGRGFPATKPRVLHNHDGFVVSGTEGVGLYCHVYVAGKTTMSCSLDDPSLVHNSYGFDMTDSSVVVFRYDRAMNRHDLKTIPQP